LLDDTLFSNFTSTRTANGSDSINSISEMLGGSSSPGILGQYPIRHPFDGCPSGGHGRECSREHIRTDTPFSDQEAVTEAEAPEPSPILLTGAALLLLFTFLGATGARRGKSFITLGKAIPAEIKTSEGGGRAQVQ
jgi:hypothetical protein